VTTQQLSQVTPQKIVEGKELDIESSRGSNEKAETVKAHQEAETSEAELFLRLSVIEQFQSLAASGLAEIIAGSINPNTAKKELSSWFQSLSQEAKDSNRGLLREAALHIQRQVEDVMLETPVIFM
jgi:hypothetical protein